MKMEHARKKFSLQIFLVHDNILLYEKVFELKIPKPCFLTIKRRSDVIACDLWFGPPQSKILATPMLGGTLFLKCFSAKVHKTLAFVPWQVASSTVTNSYETFPSFLGLTYGTIRKVG